MKSSIGQESLADQVDRNKDGVADQAEKAFKETSQPQPQPSTGSPTEDANRPSQKPPQGRPGA